MDAKDTSPEATTPGDAQDPPDPGPVPFDTVLMDELEHVLARRKYVCGEMNLPEEEDGFRPLPQAEPAGAVEDAKEKLRRVGVLDRHLVGLAFSGGGIRSATFNIGVLQALADLKLLRRVDYLSTVSGGGYAGGWFAAWLKREGNLTSVEEQLSPSRVRQKNPDRVAVGPDRIVDEEPEPLHHLRAYSDYLAPWMGLFTADSWTLVAIYLRNTLTNFLLLLPLTMLVVVLVRLVVWCFGWSVDRNSSWLVILFVGFMFLLGGAFCGLGNGIARLQQARSTNPTRGRGSLHALDLWWRSLIPLFACAVLAAWFFSVNPPADGSIIPPSLWTRETLRLRVPRAVLGLPLDALQPMELPSFLPSLAERQGDPFTVWKKSGFLWVSAVEYGLIFGAIHVVGHMLGLVSFRWYRGNRAPITPGRWRATEDETRDGRAFLTAVASGFSGGVLFAFVVAKGSGWFAGQPAAAATFGPPLAVLCFVAATIIEVWLLARCQREDVREWWAKVCALLLMGAAAWLAVFALVLYLPALVYRFRDYYVGSTLTAGWLLTSAGGVLAGRSGRTGDPKSSDWRLEFLASVAPTVFLCGLLGAVGLLVSALVDVNPPFPTAKVRTSVMAYWLGVNTVNGWLLVAWGALCGVAVLVAEKASDVNLFSLHSLYSNRLTRCYLGASRPKREWYHRTSGDVSWLPKGALQLQRTWESLAKMDRSWLPGPGGAPTPVGGKPRPADAYPGKPRAMEARTLRQENLVTGFDPDDDIPLRKFRTGDPTADPIDATVYWGPYPLINASLNLVAGKDLAWKDRKGESFTLSPLYCGSKSTWYRKLGPSADGNLTLGRAMAISGAAADPNMGSHTSAPLTALMTVFNARLGWWLQNPRYDGWNGGGPSSAWPIVSELLGQTDETHSYVHLSDGGHFENLGVYELVRRRCRYIIACDAGQDPDASFEDLARLIRLCRTDFGVRIEIDVDALRPSGVPRLSRRHCAVGRIHYDDVDGGEVPGFLLYIKASLTGDETTDVRNYATLNDAFPHQTTADQFFDEAQFESYRALGFHAARGALVDALDEAEDIQPLWTEESCDLEFTRGNRRLFAAVQRRWGTEPPNSAESFAEAAAPWLAFQGDLIAVERLREFSSEIYPELEIPVADFDGRRLELHTVARMLQILENAWVGLLREGGGTLPMNWGWLAVFRRWTSTEVVRRYWPILRAEYSEEFVRFCETQLRLRAVPRYVSIAPDHTFYQQSVAALDDEFLREWPDQPVPSQRVAEAQTLWEGRDHVPPWLFILMPHDDKAPAGSRPEHHACGVVVFAPRGDEGLDLFVWIRRAYRSLGIASRVAQPIFEDVCRAISDGRGVAVPVRVFVSYPAMADPPGVQGGKRSLYKIRDRDLEFQLWWNFFSLYDFRPQPRGQSFLPSEDVVLQREFLISPSGNPS